MLDIIKKPIIYTFAVYSMQSLSLYAYDISDSMSIEGTLTLISQHADLDGVFDEDGDKISDTNRGAAVIDIGANFHPTDNDQFQLTYSFAEGTAINGLEAFTLAPFADDLEEDLSDINSSGRYNLLEAWYKHNFTLNENTSIGITLGIIGSTGYIDSNEIANDEISQFMNDIFVNNTLANLPDYDTGVAIEFNSGPWSLNTVIMNSENDDQNDYNYYSIQLGYQLTTKWGLGNYRLYGFTTDEEFLDSDGIDKEKLTGIGLSVDQQLNQSTSLFARVGTQQDDAALDHNKMISAGVSISGDSWSRSSDTLAIGFAYLHGANDSEIDHTIALETYYKFMLSEIFDITIDAQWIEDDLESAENAEGYVVGLRFNTNF